MNILKRFVKDTEGQDLIEYGLLIGIIAIGAIAVFPAIATKVTAYYTDLNAALP